MGMHNDLSKAKLEKLEEEYAEITGGSALVTAESTEMSRYRFADGAEAVGTDDAVKQGQALVNFARNLRDRRP